jgi:hypothetical protein
MNVWDVWRSDLWVQIIESGIGCAIAGPLVVVDDLEASSFGRLISWYRRQC